MDLAFLWNSLFQFPIYCFFSLWFFSCSFPPPIFSECSQTRWLHRFGVGDDPSLTSPTFYDDNWEELKGIRDFRFHGIKTLNGIVCDRFRFRGEIFQNSPRSGIFFSRIGDAGEVFWNGVKIGGEGVVGNMFIEATRVEGLYEILEGLVRLNEENVLVLSVMNT